MSALYCARCRGPLTSEPDTDGSGRLVDLVEPCGCARGRLQIRGGGLLHAERVELEELRARDAKRKAITQRQVAKRRARRGLTKTLTCEGCDGVFEMPRRRGPYPRRCSGCR